MNEYNPLNPQFWPGSETPISYVDMSRSPEAIKLRYGEDFCAHLNKDKEKTEEDKTHTEKENE